MSAMITPVMGNWEINRTLEETSFHAENPATIRLRGMPGPCPSCDLTLFAPTTVDARIATPGTGLLSTLPKLDVEAILDRIDLQRLADWLHAIGIEPRRKCRMCDGEGTLRSAEKPGRRHTCPDCGGAKLVMEGSK